MDICKIIAFIPFPYYKSWASRQDFQCTCCMLVANFQLPHYQTYRPWINWLMVGYVYLLSLNISIGTDIWNFLWHSLPVLCSVLYSCTSYPDHSSFWDIHGKLSINSHGFTLQGCILNLGLLWCSLVVLHLVCTFLGFIFDSVEGCLSCSYSYYIIYYGQKNLAPFFLFIDGIIGKD